MKINCDAWRDVRLPGAGQCTRNKFGGRPSHGTCARCLGIALPAATVSVDSLPDALPAILSEAQKGRVLIHRRICEQCEHHRRFTKLTVHCQGCGCAGLSLLRGKCPRDKWVRDGAPPHASHA